MRLLDAVSMSLRPISVTSSGEYPEISVTDGVTNSTFPWAEKTIMTSLTVSVMALIFSASRWALAAAVPASSAAERLEL